MLKSNEVLRILRISRPTLCTYVKTGKVKATKLPNGRYDYDEASVYQFINKDITRRTYLYARVSTPKQKADLANQVEILKQFCFSNGYQVSGIFSDIAPGTGFDKRKDFFRLLDDVVAGKVERVVIMYKDRLSRVGFELFQHLFEHYHCKIVVVSEIGSEKLDSQEAPEDVADLLRCYGAGQYPARQVQAVRKALADAGR